jgi:hypothetical protein
MIKKYSTLKKANDAPDIPQQVRDAFVSTGEEQRVLPEGAMLKIQRVYGGGVLNPVVEHAGDIIHRMTHMLKWNSDSPYRTGFEYVSKKVRDVLYYLQNDYGFQREMLENIKNNAKYGGKDPEAERIKVFSLLEDYAKEHSKLKVYNRAQWLARQTCVSIGKRDWKTAIVFLQEMQKHLNSVEEWDKFATEFELNPDGSVKEYRA